MQERDGGAVYTAHIIERRYNMAGLKENTPDEVKQAIENLLHVVAKYPNAVVIGYAFSAEPVWITAMGNVKEGQFNGTLESIHTLAKTKQTQGLVVRNIVKRPS